MIYTLRKALLSVDSTMPAHDDGDGICLVEASRLTAATASLPIRHCDWPQVAEPDRAGPVSASRHFKGRQRRSAAMLEEHRFSTCRARFETVVLGAA
jgi:hypothetical protein